MGLGICMFAGVDLSPCQFIYLLISLEANNVYRTRKVDTCKRMHISSIYLSLIWFFTRTSTEVKCN